MLCVVLPNISGILYVFISNACFKIKVYHYEQVLLSYVRLKLNYMQDSYYKNIVVYLGIQFIIWTSVLTFYETYIIIAVYEYLSFIKLYAK